MMKKNAQMSYKKMIDETIKIPDNEGNGTLKYSVSVDDDGRLKRYSLVYVNPRLCAVDNGRVLGYDNGHGRHHRHYMGKEEAVVFENYAAIAEKFEQEWRVLHGKAKKSSR